MSDRESGSRAQQEETETELEYAADHSGARHADAGDVEDVISRRAEKVGKPPDEPNPDDRPPPKQYGDTERHM
jgi:hypothetical protein